MNNGKHTPGPWKVSHDLGDGYSIAREVDGHGSASGKLLPVALAVFTAGNYNEPENRNVAKANAALIAAAPELLEALKKLHSYFITDNIPDASLPDDEDFVRMENASHAAIAKAEGR